MDAGLTGYVDDFVHRIDNRIGFAPLMDDKTSLVLRYDPAHGDEFFFSAIDAGKINKAGGQAYGTAFHFPPRNISHFLQFCCRWLPVFEAHGFHADIAMRYEVTFIDSRLRSPYPLQIPRCRMIMPVYAV